MFPSNSETPAKNLDVVINNHLASMQDMKTENPEYPEMVKQLDTLYSLRNASAPKPLSADTKLLAITNLAGILLIIKHEQVGVITSKALGFISKLR